LKFGDFSFRQEKQNGGYAFERIKCRKRPEKSWFPIVTQHQPSSNHVMPNQVDIIEAWSNSEA